VNLLNVHEVASILRISEGLTYRLLDRGELPKLKIGGAVRVHPDDLEQYMNSQRKAAA
jgi:excisionase family DNA binding protein